MVSGQSRKLPPLEADESLTFISEALQQQQQPHGVFKRIENMHFLTQTMELVDTRRGKIEKNKRMGGKRGHVCTVRRDSGSPGVKL